MRLCILIALCIGLSGCAFYRDLGMTAGFAVAQTIELAAEHAKADAAAQAIIASHAGILDTGHHPERPPSQSPRPRSTWTLGVVRHRRMRPWRKCWVLDVRRFLAVC